VIVLILITYNYQTLNRTNEQITKESFSNFMARVRAEQITQVQFAEKDLFYADLANKKYLTTLPFESPQLVDSLVSLGIKVSATRPSRWLGIISYLMPVLLLVLFWFIFLRGMNSQNSKAFSFGKSKARLHEASKSGITFKDVAEWTKPRKNCRKLWSF
jgi:cell division protease FtsH